MNKSRRDNHIYFSLLWPIYINPHSIQFPVCRDYTTGFDRGKCSPEHRYFRSHTHSLFISSGEGGAAEKRNRARVDTSRRAPGTEVSHGKRSSGRATMSSDLSTDFSIRGLDSGSAPCYRHILGQAYSLGRVKGLGDQHVLGLHVWLLLL